MWKTHRKSARKGLDCASARRSRKTCVAMTGPAINALKVSNLNPTLTLWMVPHARSSTIQPVPCNSMDKYPNQCKAAKDRCNYDENATPKCQDSKTSEHTNILDDVLIPISRQKSDSDHQQRSDSLDTQKEIKS